MFQSFQRNSINLVMQEKVPPVNREPLYNLRHVRILLRGETLP
jgi:hypothetical protein